MNTEAISHTRFIACFPVEPAQTASSFYAGLPFGRRHADRGAARRRMPASMHRQAAPATLQACAMPAFA